MWLKWRRASPDMNWRWEPLAGDEEEGYAPINYWPTTRKHEPSSILEASEREHLHTTGLFAKPLASLDERSRRIVGSPLVAARIMERRCTNWLPSSMFLPSAYARSNRRPLSKMTDTFGAAGSK